MSSPSEELPSHIGKYRVVSRLGEGATSEVFLARDEFRQIDVAIKRLRQGVIDDYERLSAAFFASEAALAGRLHHPNVVQIMDAVSDGPTPYLVMEYVPGLTLRRFCRANLLLPLEQIAEIGFKCAMALSYCWKQGLIHRDIKPANILALMDGDRIADVKITDFGSVLNLGSDHTQVLRVGSLSYMAPEQLEGIELDARADMYALAAVMYHLVCGRPPVQAPTQAAMMQAIARGEVPSLVGQREGVTPALDNFLRRALSRRREDRPANWEAFASGLAALVRWQQVPRATTQSVLDSERFSLLRALEFFADFDDVQLWEVARRARWQRFARGEHIYRKGEVGSSFHIIAQGQVEVFREGRLVASMDAGTSVGEMSYLAPNPALRTHSADVVASQPATTVCFTPDSLRQTTLGTRSRFDAAFIKVLVRRLHAAQESLAQARAVGPLAGVSPAATLPPVAPSRPRAVAPERARAAPRPFAESRFG
jgi:CRP-like cAMP-binding protein/tRNA A-37 threonylcarbamoyl transferase component Bud32